MKIFADFDGVNVGTVIQRNNCVVKWIPPNKYYTKISTDGAIFADNSFGGIGVVIRDSLGSLIPAKFIQVEW